MNSAITQILELRDHPQLFLQVVNFNTVSSFIEGFDRALRGSALFGFREWLAVRRGSGTNFVWEVNVLAEVGVEYPYALSPEQDAAAIQATFSLLEQFGTEVRTQVELLSLLERFKRLQDGPRRVKRAKSRRVTRAK